MKKLIKFKRFNSITEAELAKNFLKSHNIQAQVSNSGIEFPGDRGDAFGADFSVQEEDFEKAKEILENSNKIYKTKPMPSQQSNLEQQVNQPSSPPNNLPQKPKFNLKYILIVVILAAIVNGGVLTYQYWWLPKHETKPPEITIKNETANWQTYRNDEHGFEVKYPLNWSVRSASSEETKYGKVVFLSSPETQEKINKQEIVIYSDLEISFFKDANDNIVGSYPGQPQYANLADLLTDKNQIIQKTGEINVSGHKAYEVIIGGAGSNYGIMIENNGIYELFFGSAYDRKLNDTENQILSTFKFIEPADTTDWQTYRNEEYGFEVQYPIGAKADEEFLKQGFIDFVGIDNKDMVIRVSFYGNFRNDKTLQQLFETRNGVSNLIPANFEDYSQIKINGINALKKINTIPDGKRIGATIIILGSSYYYLIETGDQYTPFFEQTQESLFDEFASTFKFIGPADSANWQTYRNEEYGFETKYPTIYNVKIDSNEIGFFLARFENQQYIAYYKISVTENTKNPKYSNFVSNPECYERIREDNYSDVDWTLNWWQCSSGGDKNPITAYTIKGNYVFEVLLDSDSRNSSIEKINQILSTFKFIPR